ncbi:MAG: CDP-glucose 4,6-dehydratase [Planctomycetaceae bacterium]|nr:CDP-glucose 4,6-dehydratase [Planctomycetaceae bacterium]
MDSWRGRSVFVTGHTGFKGAWLALELAKRGAIVHGYALHPKGPHNLFELAGVERVLATDVRADIADAERLETSLRRSEAQVVFHLAAQALVGEGHRDPVGTFGANVMGTVHLLDGMRRCPHVRAAVFVTTDKVYQNGETGQRFREDNALGGDDPYSASKAAAELAVHAYATSYFGGAEGPRVATARAGNVIGGGDFSAGRLVPDCLAAFAAKEPVRLRNPDAVRPWQHVYDPLQGYVLLAESLLGPRGAAFVGPWNFGPAADDCASVLEVVTQLVSLWGGGTRVERHAEAVARAYGAESQRLRLDSTRAERELGWQRRYDLRRSLEATVSWQRAWLAGNCMESYCRSQLLGEFGRAQRHGNLPARGNAA